MCGICGEIRFKGEVAEVGPVREMAERIGQRGPDAIGLFQHNHIAVGHRRLKIIDHSEAAQQPMIDNALGLGIVYNGAIYNYPELREELQGLGYSFFSHGDTEVILKAYHAWGPDCVKRLSGMFAFCIWERDSGRCFLARDRLGIKPLYLSEVAGGLRFASTLPALARTPGVSTEIDPVALHHYMSFHAVVPAPHSLLQGVRKLPPASTLTVEPNGEMREQRYWSLAFESLPGDERLSEEDWIEKVLESLRVAVRRRLVADTPVGVLLSGGIDSSLIVGLLAEEGQNGLNSFSVGFETVGEEVGDEFKYSDIIAERFGTNHHKIFVDSREEMLPNLQGCLAAMSEPMVSHDNIGFYLLSREVSKSVRVVQSGQGADEIFAGYHWYPPLMSSNKPEEDYAKVFFDRDHEDYSRAVVSAFRGEDHSRRLVQKHFEGVETREAVEKALHLDSTVMLVDDPVKRVDNMTMAWGLEARVPFLDHKLVELAARVPADLKVREGGKYVLKEAARRVIPAEVIDRPKGYFPVPALKYIQGDTLTFVKDILNSRAARERQIFERDYLEELIDAPDDQITPLGGSKLWQVAALEGWLQVQGF